MSRPYPMFVTLISHMRPTATDFAAAAALHDPSFLLALRAADPHDTRR